MPLGDVVGVLAVCSAPWVLDAVTGVATCPGELYQQAAPVAWSMTQADVGDVLTATLGIFAVAFVVRVVVRFVFENNAGRG